MKKYNPETLRNTWAGGLIKPIRLKFVEAWEKDLDEIERLRKEMQLVIAWMGPNGLKHYKEWKEGSSQ